MSGKKYLNVAKEFAKYVGLENNTDAEIPNYSANPFTLQPIDDLLHDWDPIDDVLATISPEFLAYIVLWAKFYWRNKEEEE